MSEEKPRIRTLVCPLSVISGYKRGCCHEKISLYNTYNEIHLCPFGDKNSDGEIVCGLGTAIKSIAVNLSR